MIKKKRRRRMGKLPAALEQKIQELLFRGQFPPAIAKSTKTPIARVLAIKSALGMGGKYEHHDFSQLERVIIQGLAQDFEAKLATFFSASPYAIRRIVKAMTLWEAK